MKLRHCLPLLFLAAACGGTSEPPAASPSAPPSMAAATPAPSGPTIVAQVVAIDTAGPSITLRETTTAMGASPMASPRAGDLRPGDRTVRVEPSAAATLASIKVGDRVRVTCTNLLPAMGAGTGTMGSPAMSPAMGAGTTMAASPAMGAGAGMASPASPGAAMGGAAGASPAMGATGPMAQCDSIVSIAAEGAMAP